MHVQIINVLQPEVEVRRIYPTNAREMKITALVDPDHAWAPVLVHTDKFTDPPHVTLTINFSAPLESQRVNVLKVEHISDLSWLPKWDRW